MTYASYGSGVCWFEGCTTPATADVHVTFASGQRSVSATCPVHQEVLAQSFAQLTTEPDPAVAIAIYTYEGPWSEIRVLP